MSKCPHCGQPMPNQYNIICNDDARCVLHDGQVAGPLTAYEYAVAQYLVRHYGQHCNAERLGDWVYQLEPEPPENIGGALSCIVQRLRRKLAPIGLRITSLHRSGAGWKISRAPDSYQTAKTETVAQPTEEPAHDARVLG